MKKACYLSSARIPSKTANSIHIMKMCNALTAEGYSVVLFAYIDGNYSVEDIFKYYDVKHKFKIINCYNRKVPFYSVFNSFLMAFYSFRIKPDFVIGRDIKACFFSSLLGLKTYFETHGPIKESGRVNHFLFKRMMKLKSLQKLILITHSLKDYYLNKYPFSSSKLLVIPDGADEIVQKDIISINIRKENMLNVGFTGHLYTGKGMEIISELIPTSLFAHFHIVGGRESDIEKWSYLNEYSNVTFYGYVNHSKVKNYLSEFDIVLLPNLKKVDSNAGRNIGDWTSPLKLFEYMAMGKPIICSDLPVLREVMVNDHNCILCNPNNIDEWSEAIKNLGTNPQLSKRLGIQAKDDIATLYSWQKRARRIISEIEK